MTWNNIGSEVLLRKHGVVKGYWNYYVRNYLIQKIGKCELCGSKKRLTVHHKSYDKQTIDNFGLLCFSCHAKLHKGVENG